MVNLQSFLLSCLAGAAMAQEQYYAFYNDNQCKTGEGKHVSSMNDGCLKEVGRQGVGPAGSGGDLYDPILIGYSDENCQDEIGCNATPNSGILCIDLTSQAWQWSQKANSFRLKTNAGSAATCPNGCTGECPGGKAPTKREVDVSEVRSGMETSMKREVEARQAKSHDYAFCNNDDCTDCGTSVEPRGGGCGLEGSRKSVYYSGGGVVVLSGYTTNDQSCTNDVTGTIRMDHKGCYPLTSSVDGGPNAYQVTTFSPE